jgi:uncharacterized membrane protein YgcG
MKKIKFYIPALLVSFLLAGCYTQLAMRPSDNDYPNEQSQDNGDSYYYEAPADTEGYYTDNEPSDSNYENDEEYTDNEDGVVNNYYIGMYPYYHRYFWGYYPSIDFGFNFGYSFYDPYCWDNFYYGPWCGSYYYPPYYSYFYYNPWYYYSAYAYPYYGGHYYGGNWYHGHGLYRERSKDSYRLRNNNGLRSSYTSRGSLTRGNDTRLNKTAGVSDRDANRVKNPTRNSVSGRSGNDLRKPSINNRTRESNTIRKGNTSREVIRKKGTNRNDSHYKKGVNKSYRDSKPIERKSRVKGEVRHNNNPRTYSPPQRNYNPPQRSYSPPSRSYSHPESRGGGGSSRSGGGRSSGGGRRR